MAVNRRIPVHQGRSALDVWAQARARGTEDAAALPRSTRATAVRYTLEELAERASGNSVEVRVPPFGVCQCIEGPRHTRGTPPNVIETDAATWLELATGILDWDAAVGTGRVLASGSRSDVSDWLPLFGAQGAG